MKDLGKLVGLALLLVAAHPRAVADAAKKAQANQAQGAAAELLMQWNEVGRKLTAMAEDFFGMMEAGVRSQGLSQRDSRLAATLYRATLRGLLIDLLSTGDRTRIDEAVAEVAKRLEHNLLTRAVVSSRTDQPAGTTTTRTGSS